ncbi:MAG: hypothetical protein MHM6MM_000056 [Cercozoa sp. M6MM]
MSKPAFELDSSFCDEWGPLDTIVAVPDEDTQVAQAELTGAIRDLDLVGYDLFRKSENLAHSADWCQLERNEEEGEGFTIVDSLASRSRPTKRRWKSRRGPRLPQFARTTREPKRKVQPKRRAKWMRWRRWGRRRRWNDRTVRQPSVPIKEEWELVQVFEFGDLSKLQARKLPSTKDVRRCGALKSLNASRTGLAAATTRKPARMQRVRDEDVAFVEPSTSEDPVLTELMEKDAGMEDAHEDGETTVYATDVLLSYLMSVANAAHSFDIVAVKKDGRIVLDSRAHSDVRETVPMVHETGSNSALTGEGINAPDELSREAGSVNNTFGEQIVCGKDAVVSSNPHPFQQAAKEAGAKRASSTHYRYRELRFSARDSVRTRQRKFDSDDESEYEDDEFDDEPEEVSHAKKGKKAAKAAGEKQLGDLVIIARTQLTGYTSRFGEKQDVFARAFVECEQAKMPQHANERRPRPGVRLGDWRRKLQSQPATVSMGEIRANLPLVSRWAMQAALAGAEDFRLGFVSRKLVTNNKTHECLHVERLTMGALLPRLRLELRNAYAVLKELLDAVRTAPDGKYLYLKHPEKSQVLVYRVADDEFDNEGDEDDEDDESMSEESY